MNQENSIGQLKFFNFNILSSLNDKQLQAGKRVLGLKIIQADMFNQ